MTTQYKINNIPFEDYFIRRDLFSSGGLWTIGRNSYGMLGDNGTSHKSSPVQIYGEGTNWKSVAAGNLHSAAIKTDGTLWLWGHNTDGQLGDNSITSRSSPVQIYGGGTNWKSVSGGYYHTAAIKNDGTLWTWGYNAYGQLGDNSITSMSSPVQIYGGDTNWKHISCGRNHAAAIKTDGTLWTWGRNNDGQLGDNSRTSRSSPVQIYGGGANWKLLSCGHYYIAAIKDDGTVWAWGQNSNGQLGDNSITHRSSPVQTTAGGTNWKHISCGRYHSAAIKTDGTLWTWGHNLDGQLGDNSITNRSSPIQNVAGGTNWKLINCGGYHSAAIKTDGTLWAWGQNFYGQLGDNSTTHRSSPVQTIAGGTNWNSINCGTFSTAAIKDNF